MSEVNLPKVTADFPAMVTLEAGNHAWCTCGLTSKGPFCDGSHKGTTFRPQILQVDAPTECALCQCKKTSNAPYCDGSHNS